MSENMITYSKEGAIATISLNRPEKYNTLRFEMLDQLDASLRDANRDNGIKVILLQGAGDSFCAGFDFSGGLEHYPGITEHGYDPGVDHQSEVLRPDRRVDQRQRGRADRADQLLPSARGAGPAHR